MSKAANRPADIVIVGGGLAGLSLACHLLERDLGGRRLLVLEARDAYRHDRHWCSWAPASHPFVNCIEASWTRWRVATGSLEHVQDCPNQPYHCIPSGRLYDEAQRRLTASPHAELRLGCGVQTVRDVGGAAEIRLVSGERLRAPLVFDSRVPPHGSIPARPEAAKTGANDVDWLQDFLGWRVRSQRPVFDPTTVTLMQFQDSDEDVRFVYVLPFSEREALVEATAFAPGPVDDARHERTLQRYLRQVGCHPDYQVVAAERGRVPMSTRPTPAPSAGARVVPIGTAAGLVKSSTGYSFEAVQRWSRDVAREVAAGRRFTWRAPRSIRTLAMDRMFLAFLRRHPRRMPALFLRMFEAVEPDALVRFLSDRGTLRDAAAVAMALPKLAMLGEAVRSLRLWARSA